MSAAGKRIAARLAVSLALCTALIGAHALVADLLDRAGLVERLLSPSGLDAVAALAAALVLFGLRFAVFFVLPGALFASCLLAFVGPPSPPQTPAQPKHRGQL